MCLVTPEQSREPRGRSPERPAPGVVLCCCLRPPARREHGECHGKGSARQTAVPGRRQRVPRAALTEDMGSRLDPCSSCGKCEAGRGSEAALRTQDPANGAPTPHCSTLFTPINSNLASLLGSPAFLHSRPCKKLETTTLHEAWLVLGVHTGAVPGTVENQVASIAPLWISSDSCENKLGARPPMALKG